MRTRVLIHAAGLAASCSVVALSFGVASVARAQTTLQWTAPTSGNWSDSLRWNPVGVPNNTGPNTFNALIDLAGVYTVTLDINATIENLTHSGVGAILDLGNTFSLTLNQNLDLGAELNGRRDLGGTGEVIVNGDVTFNDGARLRHTTNFQSNGTMTFANSLTDEICDTNVDHRGSAINWNGTGRIDMGRGAQLNMGLTTTFNLNSAATLGWNGMGATGTVVNNGTILKGSAGETFFDQATLTNSSTGLVRVSSGTLKANQVSNLAANTLTDGKWEVGAGATLSMVDLASATIDIMTNAAEVTLTGATSTFASLNALDTNGTAGKLSFRDGRDFTTLGNFTNDGELNVGAVGDVPLTTFTVAGGSSFTNYNSGTQALGGGTYNLVGKLKFDNTGVRTIGADVTLDGVNSGLVDQANADALNGSLTIAPTTGALSVRNRTFTTGGDLTNDGTLRVGTGATVAVQVGSSLTNLSGGVLAGGSYEVGGTLRVGNQTIDEVNANLVLDGAGSQIQTSANADALANFHLVGSTGAFTLKGNRLLTTTSLQDFTVASTGAINVEIGSALTIRQGTNLTNFNAGRFSGGDFNIQGTLRFQNAAVQVIDNRITLDGGTSDIVDFAGNNAFVPLNLIDTAGALTVRNRSFQLNQNLQVRGRLNIQGTGARDPVVFEIQGDLAQDGILELQGGGQLTVSGTLFNSGLLSGTGQINGQVVNSGTVGPGTSPGILTINGTLDMGTGSMIRVDLSSAHPIPLPGLDYDQLFITGGLAFAGGVGGRAGLFQVVDETFRGEIGQIFQNVMTWDTWAPTDGFERWDLTIEGSHLALRPIFTEHSLSLEVIGVPAPSALGLLGLAMLASRRRRST